MPKTSKATTTKRATKFGDSVEDRLGALDAAREDYNENVAEMNDDERREKTLAIKDLQAQLSAAITQGAEPCEQCGAMPLGMKQPALYEIGCLAGHGRARARTQRRAVEKWNAGEFFTPQNTSLD